MAAVTATAKGTQAGAFSPTAILLATSGDTMPYTAGRGDELHLFNTDVSPIVVTVDGSTATTVVLPNTGGTTASVAAGYAITVAAGTYQMVNLDKISTYLTGTIAITAATGAKVSACIVY